MKTATLIALFAASSLHAAVSYRVTVTQSNDFMNPRMVAHVVADGSNQRVEIETDAERAIAFDVLLSSNAGASYTALTTRLKTWFGPVRGPLLPDHAFMARQQAKLTDAYVNKEYEGHYSGRLTYTARQQGAKVDVGMTLIVSTTDAIPASAAVPLIVPPGIPEIDSVWLPKLSIIKGFPQTIDMAFTRRFEGGRPITNIVKVVVDDVKNVDVPASLFVRPQSYVHQEPIIAAPGASRRQ